MHVSLCVWMLRASVRVLACVHGVLVRVCVYVREFMRVLELLHVRMLVYVVFMCLDVPKFMCAMYAFVWMCVCVVCVCLCLI